MKCQKCEKPATFHITELTGSKPHEHHLCEEHAREYLNHSSEQGEPVGNLAATLTNGMPKKPASVSKAAQELKELDKQTCPDCGLSFFDFRSRGRLGCPNDYDCFSKQLDALILNIHGATEHVGKIPRRAGKMTSERAQLIKLRRDLDEAIRREDYAKATELRDKIKAVDLKETDSEPAGEGVADET